MQLKKKRMILFVFIFALVNSIFLCNALTATIGNARMVLRLNVGEEVEKSILVRNDNNISVRIELEAEGDLAKSLILKDKSFVLNPKEEKKAYFSIKATKNGTTETKINVKFIPPEGSAVGLSSKIIVIAGGEDRDSSEEEQTLEEQNSTNNTANTFSFTQRNNSVILENKNSLISFLKRPTIILTIVLLVFLIGLFVFYKRRKTEFKVFDFDSKKGIDEEVINKKVKKITEYV